MNETCMEAYAPHIDCWRGDPAVVWTHALGDTLTALSYFAISVALFYLARKYRVKRLSGVFLLYGAFICLCGMTHVFDVATIWYGGRALYLADGIVRDLTGAVSVAAAVATVRCLGSALGMFSRLAVMERPAAERIVRLDTDPRYDTPEDRKWRRDLGEIEDLARMAREFVGEGET